MGKINKFTGIYQLDVGIDVEVAIQYEIGVRDVERKLLGGFTNEFINTSGCASPITRELLKPRMLMYAFEERVVKIIFQNKPLMDEFITNPDNAGLIRRVKNEEFTGYIANLINPLAARIST